MNDESNRHLEEIRDELRAIRKYMDYFASVAKKEMSEDQEMGKYEHQSSVKSRIKSEIIKAIPGAALLILFFGGLLLAKSMEWIN